MISSSVAGPGLWQGAAGDDLSVDGAMIYQLNIDKKRKFCMNAIG